MLVPRMMPVDLCWLNVAHGVPRFRCFSTCPAPPDEVVEWCQSIPWAVRLGGEVFSWPVLVVPPTLPGLAWMLALMGAHAAIAGREPPADQGLADAMIGAAVTWSGPLQEMDGRWSFRVVFMLSPLDPPPPRELLDSLTAVVRPGGRIVLAFSASVEHPLELPRGWSVTSGEPTVVPGTGQFDSSAWDDACRSWAWSGRDGPMAVVGCTRVP